MLVLVLVGTFHKTENRGEYKVTFHKIKHRLQALDIFRFFKPFIGVYKQLLVQKTEIYRVLII